MIKTRKIHLRTWLDTLSGQGRTSFSKKEAALALGLTPSALTLSLMRQTKAGVLAKPRNGFYLIVDPGHRSLGCLPSEWFIADLMGFLKLPYYVAGLSAAVIHGSSPQAVQELQVVIPWQRAELRPITCGRVRIHFMRKPAFKSAKSIDHKVPTGYFKVSDPETTAWDLVYFQKCAGGLDHVATVLRDLAEALDAENLERTLKNHGDNLIARRLGYILQFLGQNKIAKACKLREPSPLRIFDPRAARDSGNQKVDPTWNLIINRALDPDE